MLTQFITRKRVTLLATIMASAMSIGSVQAKVDEIHFLVPGGAGGGWDSTARGTGEALSKSELVDKVSYENMSGGGGGKAIAYLIKTAEQSQDTLMVNSTPIVIRSLSKVFPQSFRDLTPVAATIGDYAPLLWQKIHLISLSMNSPKNIRKTLAQSLLLVVLLGVVWITLLRHWLSKPLVVNHVA